MIKEDQSLLKRTEVKELLANNAAVGSKVLVKGWVRAFRSNRFIGLNDGSSVGNIQVVVDFENFDEITLKQIGFHACIEVVGSLVESQGKGQSVEILAEEIKILGRVDTDKYPLQAKVMTNEFLRENAHFRMRTQTFSSVFRLRHGVAYAIHKYFFDRGYYYIHTPIITANDAEGAGETFQVTTLDVTKPQLTEDGIVDWRQDFFGKKTNLTVSGQLQAEIGALALGKVYTFGPTFRAENSNTTRHLAEFWMIEPEVAFADLEEDMDLAEDFIKYIIRFALENYRPDIQFLNDRIEKQERNLPQAQRRSMSLIDSLEFVVKGAFERISYTEAVRQLRNSKAYKKGKFKFDVEWGSDLHAEHERYLVEKKYGKPVIIRDYPKDIKAFYMRVNDDQKTVAAMDVLFPSIGEVIGGSQREERLEVLQRRMAAMDIPEHELDWYLDLRRFGGCPHAGFGLGFERIVQFITGMSNIRDVTAFPRTPGSANF